MSRTSALLTALAVLTVAGATGVGVVLTARESPRACGSSVVGRDAEALPLVRSAPRELLAALEPAGEVVASIGYDYEPVQLSGYDVGLGVRVVDDPTFTMLDGDGEPLWGVDVGTQRSTFDADAASYVVVTLPPGEPPEVVAIDLATGDRRWCARLGEPVASATVSTALLPDGSVTTLAADGEEQALSRVDRQGIRWTRQEAAGAGDYLGMLDGERLLLGGSALPDLLDPGRLAQTPAGVRVVAVDAATGESSWTLEEPAGTDVSVVGVGTEGVVLQRSVAGESQPTLVGLDADGEERWSVSPARGTAFDATLRGDLVVTRTGTTWAAYDAGSGDRRWRFEVPASPQLLPYGASLDSFPALDADTLLVGGTEALLALDLDQGGLEPLVDLPTDGVATTYWPQRVVLSPDLLGVVTNTGTVLLRREGAFS